MVPLSVVIPTFNRRESLRRALLSLAGQNMQPENFEVVVSIDGSTDGTCEMLAGLNTPYRLHAVPRPHAGRSSTRNAGIYAAKGDVVLLLDDDMQATPDLLSVHSRAHATARHEVAVLGGVPVPLKPGDPGAVRYIGGKFNRHLNTLAEPGRQVGLRDFYAGNCSIRRATLLRVGLFDEDFTVYGNEDLELWVRLVSAGVEVVYASDAVAYQSYEKDFRRLAEDNQNKGRTAVILAGKHPDVLPALKLAGYQTDLPRWRYARDALLAMSVRWSRLPRLVAELIAVLDRAGVALPDTGYALILDYFYWLGAREALQHEPALMARMRAMKAVP